MSRAFDAAIITALQVDHTALRYFAELELDGGTERLWTGLGQITTTQGTWQGVGGLATIEGLEEGVDLSAFSLRLGLSRLDNQVANLAINEQFWHRPITLYLSAVGADGGLVADPDVVFSGEMLTVEATVGADGGEVIMLTCENELARLERTSNLRYTDVQLQSEYSGDVAFEYLTELKDYRPTWRGRNQTRLGESGGGTSGGGGSNRGGGNRGIRDRR